MARIGMGSVRTLLPPIIGLLFLAPVLWMASQSLQQTGVPPKPAINLIPIPAHIENFVRVFEVFPLIDPLWHTLLLEAVAVPLTLVTASLGGLAMALLPVRARRWLVTLAIVLLVIPFPAVWLPRFLLFTALGAIDTYIPLIAPAIMGTSPFFVLLFYWTFRRFPSGLFEAARLDGASLLQTWRRVALPLARPTISVVAVLAFAFHWNDYMSALIFLRSISNYTIALRLQMFQGGDVTLLPLQMAGTLIGILPVILLFLLVQHYLWPEGRAAILSGS